MKPAVIQLNDLDAEPRRQSSRAYNILKADLLAGRVDPGDKLKINDLALQLEVSPGAIREALSRLVPEGLVLSRDQRGFVVAPLSTDDLQDLTWLRAEIEELALRRAVALGDAEWEAGILAAAHRLRRTPRRLAGDLPNSGWASEHEKFHRALVAACGSPRLLAFHAHLYQQAERYRNLSTYAETERDIEGEHQALVDAALDRDAELLVRLVQEHLQRTAFLVRLVSKQGRADRRDPPGRPS